MARFSEAMLDEMDTTQDLLFMANDTENVFCFGPTCVFLSWSNIWISTFYSFT